MERVEHFITKHPIATVLGFFLFLGSLEKGVPLIADPISRTAWRICEAIFF